MKYLPLIWSGIWRKPGRTTLVLLQVALAFTLFGVLQGMKTGVDPAVANARAVFLMVIAEALCVCVAAASRAARLRVAEALAGR